ncbi:MAG: DegQ family serine endoprotease [Planctomycetota bacterium]
MHQSSTTPRRLMAAMLTVAIVATIVVLPRVRADSDPASRRSDGAAAADALAGAFKDAARSVAPSVVHITAIDRTELAGSGRGMPDFGPPFGQHPFGQDFFRRFFDGMGPNGSVPPGRPRPQGFTAGPDRQAQGTGFIVSDDGYVVTNNHVVAEAEEVKVKLDDDREYEATVVGRDPETDLAVLKIDAAGLTAVTLGASEAVEVGEWVIAVGSPFGLEQTVTAGIVSATGRSGMGLTTFEDFIQTDAAINPGNSGGPLVNLHGEVVGVNTAIQTRSGGNNGIGFAIPSDLVRTVMQDIIDDGKVTRGWLGVQIQPLSGELAASFGLEHARGVLIADVMQDGPAAAAGLETGDVVLAIDDQRVDTPRELLHAVALSEPGEAILVDLIRQGREQQLSAVLGERPSAGQSAGGAAPTTRDDLGLTVRPPAPNETRAGGVVVESVQPGAAAAKAGLRPGDVIVRVGLHEIADVAGFRSAIDGTDLETGVALLIERNGSRQYVVLKTGNE